MTLNLLSITTYLLFVFFIGQRGAVGSLRCLWYLRVYRGIWRRFLAVSLWSVNFSETSSSRLSLTVFCHNTFIDTKIGLCASLLVFEGVILGAVSSLSIRMIMIAATTSSWIIAVPAILEIVKSLIAVLVIRLRNLLSILITPLFVVVRLISFRRFWVVGLSPSLWMLRSVLVIPSPFLKWLRRLLVTALTGFVLEVGLLSVGLFAALIHLILLKKIVFCLYEK